MISFPLVAESFKKSLNKTRENPGTDTHSLCFNSTDLLGPYLLEYRTYSQTCGACSLLLITQLFDILLSDTLYAHTVFITLSLREANFVKPTSYGPSTDLSL